jgi:hypothetical protein
VRREQLAHVLRAAATITKDNDILVIGSNAILATFDEDDLPEETTMSIEVDIAFFDDPDELKADLVDGAIGEASMFHASHGVYGQGVGLTTAVLPDGWRTRLVVFEASAAAPSRALCLEAHDLVVSKLVAGLAQLADAVGAEFKATVYIGAVLGLRWGEVAGLRVHSLDILGRTVTVAEQRTRACRAA